MPKLSLTFTTFLVLFFCLTTCAQVRLGIEAGPDFPRLLQFIQEFSANGKASNVNSQSITRIEGGVFADIPLCKNEQFVLRPRLNYFGAGGQVPQLVDFNGNQIEPKAKFTFDYIELPLQLLYSPSFSFGKPWLGGGFYPAILLKANSKYTWGSESIPIGSGSNDGIKRFDFGFNATAGLTLNCGFLLGVDYQQSLVGIFPNPPAGLPAHKVRSSIWGAHIGYTWSLGRKSQPKNAH